MAEDAEKAKGEDSEIGHAYDANGNTLSDAQGRSFTWDFENRLTQVVVPGTNGGTTTFKYDPFGRRIQKSGPLGTTNYLYDGMSATAVEELDNGGNELASYMQGPGTDQPIAEFRSSTASYYLADGSGSITSLSSASGTLSNTYAYDSFGRLTTSTGSLTNPFQFTARDSDAETGLYYYRARYYDQALGRFVTEDPTGFDGGSLNFYSYVGNRPTTFTDPSGLRVLNPNNYPVSGNVMGALQKFNKCIGCDKDLVITGGDRPSSATIGAGSNSTHVQHLAADIFVPGQLNIVTANQAEQCGGLGGIGWYQEGYRGSKGEGPHVHVDLRGSTARWGYYASGRETHGYIPFAPTEINLSPPGCNCH